LVLRRYSTYIPHSRKHTAPPTEAPITYAGRSLLSLASPVADGAVVGNTDGATVEGRTVGARDGRTDGFDVVGDLLGGVLGRALLGRVVGRAVGATVGCWDGNTEGFTVTTTAAVGFDVLVGPCVLGSLVGGAETDGDEEGALFGDTDGASDKLTEGRWLGAAEGLRDGTASDVVNCESVTGTVVAAVVIAKVVALTGKLSAWNTASLCLANPVGSWINDMCAINTDCTEELCDNEHARAKYAPATTILVQ